MGTSLGIILIGTFGICCLRSNFRTSSRYARRWSFSNIDREDIKLFNKEWLWGNLSITSERNGREIRGRLKKRTKLNATWRRDDKTMDKWNIAVAGRREIKVRGRDLKEIYGRAEWNIMWRFDIW